MPGQPPVVLAPDKIAPAIDESLTRLGCDHIDVILIAVADLPEHFQVVTDELIPALLKVKESGKVCFIGSSEQTRSDGDHAWLRHALPLDFLDVVMVGHNLINQSAQRSVLPLCVKQDVGAFNIFTVRKVLSNQLRLQQVVSDLKESAGWSKRGLCRKRIRSGGCWMAIVAL